MGNQAERIQTSSIPEINVRYADPPLPHRYHPPFRRFGKVQEKKKGRFVTYSLAITDPFHQKVSTSFEVFDKLLDAFEVKTEKMFIQSAIKEEYIDDRWIYQTDTDGTKQTILVRPYTDNGSHNFASILCQVSFIKMVNQFPCANLHQCEDSYTIESNMSLLPQPNSHIIVMERVDATLSQVIKFKRAHKWNWTVPEFHRLVSDLVEAVFTLHEAEITHNDIRPSVVYYSLARKCYILGSYGACMSEEGSTGVIVRGSTRRTLSKIETEVNRKQFDVHSLGMTLMSAFYLSEIVDYEVAANQNRLLMDQYEVLQVINAMLAPPDKRATIQQIKRKLPRMSHDEDYMQEMISSMNHRERPTPSEAIAQKISIASAYQHLGLWNEWKKEYEEAYQLTEKNNQGVEEAEQLMHLALIDHCRGDFRASDSYAKEAAVKYREFGQNHLQEHCLGAAESYFKKAVSCAKFYELDPDPDLALSLSGLSLVHRNKSAYNYSKTLAKAATQVVIKYQAEGKNTIQYGVHYLKEARLQMETGNNEGAQKMIEHCLTLAERLKDINMDGSIALKGEALVAKAHNYDNWAERLPQLEQHFILDKGKSAAKEAVQTYQCIEEDHHLQLADVVTTVGRINMKRRNYHESIREYTRALQLLEAFQDQNHSNELKERAQLLCLRGDARSCVGEYEDSIEDYLKGLKIYKDRYGSHHNRLSALAFGNLARIYARLNMDQQALQCVKTSMQILRDVASRNDPKYTELQQLQNSLKR